MSKEKKDLTWRELCEEMDLPPDWIDWPEDRLQSELERRCKEKGILFPVILEPRKEELDAVKRSVLEKLNDKKKEGDS